METSLRRSGGGGKEVKRGTSPSSSTIKKSPKPSSSTPNDEKTISTTDTSKPVPNYLKPTMSSSLDFSRIPKKPSMEGSAQKLALNRRRSFERPPPASQVSRAIRGPPSGTRDIKPQRSTSFSIKSGNTPSASSSSSTRPGSEKLFARASSLKDRKVGPDLTKSWSVKRSGLSSTSAKREPTSSSSSAAKKPPRSVTSESSVECESRSVDHLVIEDDFVNLDDSEVQSLPEMSEMPECNKELADPTNVEVEEFEHHEEDPKESIVEEDHQPHHEDKSTVVEQVMEEPVAVLEEDAAKQETEKTDHQTVEEESADDQPKGEPAGKQNLVEDAGDQQDDSDIKVLEVVPTETMVEETMEEEVEETNEREAEKEEKKTEAKDEKLVEETVNSPRPADTAAVTAAAAPVKTQASAAGKKDKQVYNDVIEETASKLMGNSSKKNKVLALAGAFETVISLQDTKKR